MEVGLPNGMDNSPQDTRTNDPKTWPNGLYAYMENEKPCLAVFNMQATYLCDTSIRPWRGMAPPRDYTRIPGYTGNFTKLIAEVE